METRSDLPSTALGLICQGKRSGAAATFSGRSKDPSRPTGALSHEWKNIKNRLQLVALKVRNNLDQGLPLGEWITSIPQRPCKGLIIVGGVGPHR